MKTLLLLLLLTSAAQADQWLVNGRTYKGTLHKLSADRSQVWVTSDWDNYSGSWLKVAELDPATRVLLQVATPQEQAAVQLQMERAALEQEQARQLQAQAQERAAAERAAAERAAAERAARMEEQRLVLQRQQLEIERQQLALQRRQEAHRASGQQSSQSSTQIYIIPSARGTAGQGVTQTPGFVQYPQVPGFVQYPQVRGGTRTHRAQQAPQAQFGTPTVLWYK